VDGESAFLQFDREYLPDFETTQRYDKIVQDYQALAEGLDPVMVRLFG
jgi:hypothetical protein